MPGKKILSKLESKIKQATPLELVVIAYDGAIEALEMAEKSLKAKNLKEFLSSITKARKIVLELKKSLDMDIQGISQNLANLYTVIDDLLVKVSKKKDLEALDQVIKMLIELREAWQIISKQKQAPA